MQNLEFGGTSNTPEIRLNAANGLISFKGRSIPENSIEFYKPVFDWVDEYCSFPANSTKITVQLEYFNTSSSKCLLDIFKKLEKLKPAGKSVKILWVYESDDEDMFEAGEDYESIINIPFEFKEIEI